MLGDALSFPRGGDDWLPTILIGGVLSVLSVLILPVFVLQGYLVRVLREAAGDAEAAPSFTEWGELLVDGLKLIAINLAYGLIVVVPGVVGAVVVGGLGVVVGDGSTAGALGVGAVGLAFALVFTLLALVLGYLIPAAMVNFAIEGRMGAAFDFGTLRRGAFTSEYATAWILAVLVGLVGGLVGSALSLLVVGIFVLFYVQVATYYLFGRGFAAGLGKRRMAAA